MKRMMAYVMAILILCVNIGAVTGVAAENLDAAALTYAQLSVSENGSTEITRSLYLPSVGFVSSNPIAWSSSDEAHITSSGRVIRPRSDENDAAVTLTASFSSGVTREFNFVVLHDTAFSDPNYMTDEEFFGHYDSSTGTFIQGKLNYSYSTDMTNIKRYARLGNYSAAKNALAVYFKNRIAPVQFINRRNTQWADIVVDDFYQKGAQDVFAGTLTVDNSFKFHECSLNPSLIVSGPTSYSLRAKYNEMSYAQIASADNANSAFAPCVELTVNGQQRTYYATKDTSISMGENFKTNYQGEEYLRSQMFGDFLSSDTYYAIVTFDFNDITANDIISSACLKLYARCVPDFSGSKELVVVNEINAEYDEASATAADFPGIVFSCQGIPGANTWRKETFKNAEAEFFWQSTNFSAFNAIATEYKITANEEYAYKAIRMAEDFIVDTGNYKLSSTASYYEDKNGIRGGFPRSINAAAKNCSFAFTFDVFSASHYADGEFMTAVLKNIWDTANFLTVYNSSENNWRQHEFMSLYYIMQYFPEFYDVEQGAMWKQTTLDALENMLFLNTFADGSYKESAGGYSVSALSDFSAFRQSVIESGGSVSPEYNERLLKNAYYNALLFQPNGRGVMYGDTGVNTLNSGTFAYTYRTLNDKQLEFIATLGNNGTTPSFTAKTFYDSAVTVMRNDWTQLSPYLFTNVRGGGPHGHSDDNQIVLYSANRTFLTDAGMFSYSFYDPVSMWGRSSEAHNTVVINNINQKNDGNTGRIFNSYSNPKFDYLSQSTFQTEGFEHRRSITYIKPRMFIVSDKLIPNNLSESNTYRQLWHMQPEAKIKISPEENTVFSDYSDGQNLYVVNPSESGSSLTLKCGYFDKGIAEIVNSQYANFQKEAQGVCRFDSVLYLSDDASKPVVRQIASNENLTALEITCDNTKTYYFNSENDTIGLFEDFSTDAQSAYITYEGENITEIGITEGTYINKNGKVLFSCNKKTENASLQIENNAATIAAAEEDMIFCLGMGQIASAEYNGNEAMVAEHDGVSRVYFPNINMLSDMLTMALINNGSSNTTVLSDLYLPSHIGYQSEGDVSWESNSEHVSIEGEKGIIDRSVISADDIVLTAHITYNGETVQKDFPITIVTLKLFAGYCVETARCAVCGSVSKAFAGNMVTVMLSKPNATGSDDIYMFDITEIDENGKFAFKYPLNENIAGCELTVNVCGFVKKCTLNPVTSYDEFFACDLSLSNAEDTETLTAVIDNLYMKKSVPYILMIAFYDNNGKMTDNIYSPVKSLNDDITMDRLNIKIPTGSVSAKAFVWEGITSIRPIAQTATDLMTIPAEE